MAPPPAAALARALETLYGLAALDDEGQMTPLGRVLAELPLDPPLAACLLAAPMHGCVAEMLTVAAMLSVPSVFTR